MVERVNNLNVVTHLDIDEVLLKGHKPWKTYFSLARGRMSQELQGNNHKGPIVQLIERLACLGDREVLPGVPQAILIADSFSEAVLAVTGRRQELEKKTRDLLTRERTIVIKPGQTSGVIYEYRGVMTGVPTINSITFTPKGLSGSHVKTEKVQESLLNGREVVAADDDLKPAILEARLGSNVTVLLIDPSGFYRPGLLAFNNLWPLPDNITIVPDLLTGMEQIYQRLHAKHDQVRSGRIKGK